MNRETNDEDKGGRDWEVRR